MIPKEMFVKSLNQIIEGLEKRENFQKAMEEINDSFFVTNLGNEWLNVSLSLLSHSVGDIGDKNGTIIEWFLFESPDKKIYLKPNSYYNKTKSEIEIDVSTPELLYDFFKQYPIYKEENL